MPQVLTVGGLLSDQGERLKLNIVAGARFLDRPITVRELNRPGLALVGFLDHFRPERIQILGLGEQSYLRHADPERLRGALAGILKFPELPCLITSRATRPPRNVIDACRRAGVPLLLSGLSTAELTQELSDILDARLAPRATVHGVLVDVYGLGVLIQGEPGIGKSECALELLKRGHILIADDAIDIRRLGGGTLRGSCPEPLKNYMEVRCLGIIDVTLLFGIGAILDRTRVELAAVLEPWSQTRIVERTGIDQEHLDLLGVKVPLIRIPVSPGRNLAILIEVAALNQRLKGRGYWASRVFNKDLIKRMSKKSAKTA